MLVQDTGSEGVRKGVVHVRPRVRDRAELGRQGSPIGEAATH